MRVSGFKGLGLSDLGFKGLGISKWLDCAGAFSASGGSEFQSLRAAGFSGFTSTGFSGLRVLGFRVEAHNST